MVLVHPPVEGGEGVGEGDGDDGGQQAQPWRPHAGGGLVGCARKTESDRGSPSPVPSHPRTRGFSNEDARETRTRLRPQDDRHPRSQDDRPKKDICHFCDFEKDIWWPDSLSLFPGAEQQTDFNFWSKI